MLNVKEQLNVLCCHFHICSCMRCSDFKTATIFIGICALAVHTLCMLIAVHWQVLATVQYITCVFGRLTVRVIWPSRSLLSRPFAVVIHDLWSYGGGVIVRLHFSFTLWESVHVDRHNLSQLLLPFIVPCIASTTSVHSMIGLLDALLH